VTNGGSNVLNLDQDDYIHYREITFRGGRDTVRWNKCKGGKLESCNVHSGVGVGIIIISSEVSIENTQIYNCEESAISIIGKSNVSVRNCVIQGNQGHGIEVGKDTSITRIEECRIYNNEYNGIHIKDGNTIILNCLIYNNSGGGVKVTGSQDTMVGMEWN